ncbi:hypothetical protein FKW77_007108 [Venturia effusa]|uniref:O-methyltransferase domain-containing protein n=1 Tax=Venturia effusa TaxID=50376 RepID=A0A517KWR1_9PEZI|nr:hypothetical protein FKW77_007108 [Venturia effusa]
MKENYTELYPNEQVATAVGDYAFKHSTPLPSHITKYHELGSTHEQSDYMISPFQAQFQMWFAKAFGAKRILEIGTFIGFSTMAWSSAVGAGGHVTALEYSPDYAKLAEEAWAKEGIENCELMIGDAAESLRKLATGSQEAYDLIFIDADKISYPKYLELILEHSKGAGTRILKKGGIIVADNILRRGIIADASDANPWSKNLNKNGGLWKEGDLEAIDTFNKKLVEDKRLDTFLLPLFDGLGMARLLD